MSTSLAGLERLSPIEMLASQRAGGIPVFHDALLRWQERAWELRIGDGRLKPQCGNIGWKVMPPGRYGEVGDVKRKHRGGPANGHRG